SVCPEILCAGCHDRLPEGLMKEVSNMKNLKKWLVVLMVAVLVVTLTACSGGDKKDAAAPVLTDRSDAQNS
ncbi:MAG: hypothetical protein IIZ55_03430, partial [Firmicutes bacterium]|nr:hypothetical protein [Bacillota bacterium]